MCRMCLLFVMHEYLKNLFSPNRPFASLGKQDVIALHAACVRVRAWRYLSGRVACQHWSGTYCHGYVTAKRTALALKLKTQKRVHTRWQNLTCLRTTLGRSLMWIPKDSLQKVIHHPLTDTSSTEQRWWWYCSRCRTIGLSCWPTSMTNRMRSWTQA